mmetsp:Transcript_37494/g.118238  ORF Transcript_37494/g.118238 Transcript_37494/m.118238 type:complete len:238 (-) Transcript_37494:868-1581(-)
MRPLWWCNHDHDRRYFFTALRPSAPMTKAFQSPITASGTAASTRSLPAPYIASTSRKYASELLVTESTPALTADMSRPQRDTCPEAAKVCWTGPPWWPPGATRPGAARPTPKPPTVGWAIWSGAPAMTTPTSPCSNSAFFASLSALFFRRSIFFSSAMSFTCCCAYAMRASSLAFSSSCALTCLKALMSAAYFSASALAMVTNSTRSASCSFDHASPIALEANSNDSVSNFALFLAL